MWVMPIQQHTETTEPCCPPPVCACQSDVGPSHVIRCWASFEIDADFQFMTLLQSRFYFLFLILSSSQLELDDTPALELQQHTHRQP